MTKTLTYGDMSVLNVSGARNTVYLVPSAENGDDGPHVFVWSNVGAGQPERAYHNRWRAVGSVSETAVPDSIKATLKAHESDLLRIAAAYRDAEWNGSNYIGKWQDTEELEAIEYQIEQALENVQTFWDVSDWFSVITLPKLIQDDSTLDEIVEREVSDGAKNGAVLDADDVRRWLVDSAQECLQGDIDSLLRTRLLRLTGVEPCFQLQVLKAESTEWKTLEMFAVESDADSAGDQLREDFDHQCDMRVLDIDGDEVTRWSPTFEYARTYGNVVWVVSDGNAEVEYDNFDSAEAWPPERQAAQEYVDGGDWGESSSTVWVKVRVWRRATYRGQTYETEAQTLKLAVDPPEPKCKAGPSHDWHSPYDVVGGLKENPGVFGHGGGVRIHEICRHCGICRVTDTWAQDREDGEQGLTSVSYELGND